MKRLTGFIPVVGLCDRGYRGKNKVNDTRIIIPGAGKRDTSKAYQENMRYRFRQRAGIEPVIGHLNRIIA